MLRAYRRFAVLVGVVVLILLTMSVLYMLGMTHLEGKPRSFWQALQWAAGTTSTTGYSVDTSWNHPLMVVYVVFAQFMGVTLIFLVLPIFLIPLLEERFETRLPHESAGARDHVVVFDYGPAVATLVTDLEAARIATVIIDEDEAEARHLLEQGHRVVFGNLDEGVMDRVGLGAARALIVNGSDDRNAAAILTARQQGYAGEILALVEDPYHRHPMILAGASGAFTPRHVLGAELAARASQKLAPTVAGLAHAAPGLECVELRVVSGGPFAGRTLRDTGLAERPGLHLVGQWVRGKLRTAPGPDAIVEGGTILVAVTARSQVAAIDTIAGLRRLRQDGPFVIAGNGEVGRKVAQLLSDAGESTFMIDTRPGPGVDLVGNVLDTQVLERAGLDAARAVILALSADAPTLFGTVILRDHMPDLPVIARVNLAENLERVYAAGADFALSVAQVSGQLLSLRLLGHEAESIDARLRAVRLSAAGMAGRHPLATGGAQGGCHIIAVERARHLITEFADDFRITADDTLVVCGSEPAVGALQAAHAPRASTAGEAVGAALPV